MKKCCFLICFLLICSSAFSHDSPLLRRLGSSNHALDTDLDVGTNSIDGDSSAGIVFDPDNDETNEVTIETDGQFKFGSDSEGTAIRPAFTYTVCSSTAKAKSGCDFTADGTADDIQIQAAIDALPSNKGTIILSEGQFNISSTISIVSGGVSIIGQGIDATIIFLSNNSDVDMIKLNIGADDEFFRIAELMINGNNGNNTSGRGIYNGAGAGNIRDVFVDHVFFINMPGIAIHLESGWGALISNTIIEFGSSNGIQIEAGNGDTKIHNCKIIENDGHAIYAKNNSNIISSNYLSPGASSYGIYLEGQNNTVVGNHITDLGGTYVTTEGIYISGDKNLISSNVLVLDTDMTVGIDIVSGADRNMVTFNDVSHSGLTPYADAGIENTIIGKTGNNSSGDLEISNGSTFGIEIQPGTTIQFNSAKTDNDGKILFNTNTGGAVGGLRWDIGTDQMILAPSDSLANQLIFANYSNIDKDFDHNIQTNPTFFIQSDLNPDISNNPWGSLAHDQEDLIISTGANTGAGTAPTTNNNGILFSPRGTEQARVETAGLRVTPPSEEIIAAGATITANACGTIKKISTDDLGAVTTSTTDTVTAPASTNTGCCMTIINTGTDNITLDNNANFISIGTADIVMTANDAAEVCSDGSNWYSTSSLVAN